MFLFSDILVSMKLRVYFNFGVLGVEKLEYITLTVYRPLCHQQVCTQPPVSPAKCPFSAHCPMRKISAFACDLQKKGSYW